MTELAPEPKPIMDVIRGGMLTPRPDRLSMHHIDRRDAALEAIEQAEKATRALEELERGGTGGAQSPRHRTVRKLVADLATLHRELDDIYR